MEVKNQKPKLALYDQDGNAFAILGRAMRVAKKNGMNWNTIQAEAMSGDYDHLLITMMKYFDCGGMDSLTDEDEETDRETEF